MDGFSHVLDAGLLLVCEGGEVLMSECLSLPLFFLFLFINHISHDLP